MKAFSNVIIAMFRNICMSARASVYALYVFMFRFFFFYDTNVSEIRELNGSLSP